MAGASMVAGLPQCGSAIGLGSDVCSSRTIRVYATDDVIASRNGHHDDVAFQDIRISNWSVHARISFRK